MIVDGSTGEEGRTVGRAVGRTLKGCWVLCGVVGGLWGAMWGLWGTLGQCPRQMRSTPVASLSRAAVASLLNSCGVPTEQRWRPD